MTQERQNDLRKEAQNVIENRFPWNTPRSHGQRMVDLCWANETIEILDALSSAEAEKERIVMKVWEMAQADAGKARIVMKVWEMAQADAGKAQGQYLYVSTAPPTWAEISAELEKEEGS